MKSLSSTLKSNYLGYFEVAALSLAMIAPTMAISFNTPYAAQADGAAVPLAFLAAFVGIALVAVSFFEFSKVRPHAGSLYAYNSLGLGLKAGFLSGWLLLGTYVTFTASTAAMFGYIAQVLLQNFGIKPPWYLMTLGALALSTYLAYKDIRLSARFALIMEGLSVLIITVLSLVIVVHGGAGGNSFKPFEPSLKGWSGVGFATVFGLLSFAGFEGGATLGEEAKNSRKLVPWALFGTVIVAGTFFTFGSYAQTIGFGLNHIKAFQTSGAPLNDLAHRYLGDVAAIAVDVGTTISAFACVLGSLNASGRVLFALTRDGTVGTSFSVTHPVHRTPYKAIFLVSAVSFVIITAMYNVGPSNIYGEVATLGTLMLLVGYVLINISAIRYFRTQFSWIRHRIIPVLGALAMFWPIYSSLYPVPAYPYNILPYIALVWGVLGYGIVHLKLKKDPAHAERMLQLEEEAG
ncbi:APC family permease [Sulfobacillus thermosulfidooxidans]|uniref:APC family permease n=1 Tax=Sulfobacillus thermosulfidooxidans TaxID=28034 RepID=UPI00096B764E|nr:APC family permease [Sulfobacillus thermosulfidooxidans]OLZ11346.1 hypothetical protein BFX05_07655 [Sulfobacillus thermosulfidooxidans]OLZ14056.1 hypothetical protein BFX06_07025 [Sulfobacillus thermosulfidooxidans]OLZ19852.1 hypothetical protein BFX07_01835 [Sulfobacillus thermosulfidooxidans]